jgi:hypothetical protein
MPPSGLGVVQYSVRTDADRAPTPHGTVDSRSLMVVDSLDVA